MLKGLALLTSAFGLALAFFKWVTFKRTVEIGKQQSELERRRAEAQSGAERRKRETEVRGLSRVDIIKRLRATSDGDS